MANKNKYRKEEAFIIAHAQGISSRELADLVNRGIRNGVYDGRNAEFQESQED